MKILVIGSGGREHAIAWKIAESSLVEKVYCAPGNGGTCIENKCENVNINSIEGLKKFAIEKKIDFTIVGPEAFLVEGIVDEFKKSGLKIFGPSKEAARLEGSKSFSKEFMKKYGIKTAAYEVFENSKEALNYLEKCDYPIVIKADGLAAGKGVVICQNYEDAKSSITDFMELNTLNGAGEKIVIEEFLEGVEASILSITDGNTILPFLSSKDHKQIFDGNEGPNTGGMGVIAPNPHCDEEVLKAFNDDILVPTLKGIKEEKFDYIGIIFFGIMITKKGVYLLEYNVRMGDPETEAVLPLMENDLTEVILSAMDENLENYDLKWKNASSCCVIAASGGYPAKYKVGEKIEGYEKLNNKLFIAGGKFEDNILKTSGGRVLAVVSVEETLDKAISEAYKDMEKIKFDNIYYRKDIGKMN